jgi:alpha-D-xyloside xylohydrolase
MLSIWANPCNITQDYSEFFQRNLMLPASDNYDPFNSEARKLYWEQTKKGLFNKGVKAFWCDSSEPFCPEWVEREPEAGIMYDEYVQTTAKFIPRDKINAFGLVHAQTIYDGMRGETEDFRVCNLTRSAHTGSQRYGTTLWSGDISAKWDTLRKQIPAGLNFCVSGLPFWTLDIGGFFVKEGTQWFWNGDYDDPDNDLGFRELYTRWFQLGAFLPIFRSHGTDVRREPWHFGEKGEPFYDAIQRTIDLRYRLMPYIYSAAADASLNGGTMMRMLAFDYRQDETALSVKDQYLFGKSIMVCPVTHPMYYGVNSQKIENPVTTRRVYLPAGNDWFDFYTMERYAGGQWINVNLTLDRIPLFVKAGSIIPMTGSVRNTAQSGNARVEYRVFPGADGMFTLYEDTGDGYGYEKGEFKKTQIVWSEAQKRLFIDN